MTEEMMPMAALRKPEWLKVRLPSGPAYKHVRGILSGKGLHSVCQEARCPNIAECFHSGTAAFLILGNICTRACLYCHVAHGTPQAPDETESERLVEAAKQLQLRYMVITSVTRDDLPDGGAILFATCLEMIRRAMPDSMVELLIPDFLGNPDALDLIVQSKPDVLNHNIETGPALFGTLRPQGNYRRSLELLNRIRQSSPIITKSGFMVGFGENMDDIEEVLLDLSKIHCQRITIGQYQQPTPAHWPVKKYYHPDEFYAIGHMARSLGFQHVEAGPLVRSSYHAAKRI